MRTINLKEVSSLKNYPQKVVIWLILLIWYNSQNLKDAEDLQKYALT